MSIACRRPMWPILVLVLTGCARVDVPPVDSLLSQPVMNRQSVSFDIFTVRYPADQQEADSQLWAEIDEQSLSTDLRRRLRAHGIRAGTVSGHIPRALTELVAQRDTDLEAAADQWLMNLDEEPAVERRHVQAPPGEKILIVESEIEPEVSVFQREDDAVVGETYYKAQAIFELKAEAQADGRVRVSLIPELHHGDPTTKYVARDGATAQITAKPRIVYEQLKIDTALAPGEMLIVGDAAGHAAALGKLFFVEGDSSPPSRKLVVIRLAQTQHDGFVSDQTGADLSGSEPIQGEASVAGALRSQDR